MLNFKDDRPPEIWLESCEVLTVMLPLLLKLVLDVINLPFTIYCGYWAEALSGFRILTFLLLTVSSCLVPLLPGKCSAGGEKQIPLELSCTPLIFVSVAIVINRWLAPWSADSCCCRLILIKARRSDLFCFSFLSLIKDIILVEFYRFCFDWSWRDIWA